MRIVFLFFFTDPATTEIYTLSLHDALPISPPPPTSSHLGRGCRRASAVAALRRTRSEEHTSELQSRQYLVCRLLLEKKKQSVAERGAADPAEPPDEGDQREPRTGGTRRGYL